MRLAFVLSTALVVTLRSILKPCITFASAALLHACAPTTGALGPDARNVEAQHVGAPRFVGTSNH